MNITQAGIGSGLDLEAIIEAFVNAESIPSEIRLQEKEDRVKTELSGVGSFKSALSTFKGIAEKLDSFDNFSEQTLAVSHDDISVSTNGFASNGSFDISVLQLASATRIQTASFTDPSVMPGAGTLSFGAGSDSFSVAIDSTDDLSTIRDKINADSNNFGVTVSLINADLGSYLSYTSSKTGAINELSVTSADAALADLSTNAVVQASAQNAQIEIDGNLVTNETNEFKNNIEDVTIVAEKVSVTPVTLSISQDTEVAKSLVTEFVAGYNALIDNMLGLGAPKAGRLAFDSDLRAMRGQLNDIVINSVNGLSGSITSLNDIGVSLDKTGHLEISAIGIGSLDSGVESLNKAIENNLPALGEVFASTDGVVNQLTSLIDSFNDTEGSLTKRETSLNKDLSGISDEYEDLEVRLRSYEETLRKRFSFLDATVAQYNATGAWLTNALKLPEKD